MFCIHCDKPHNRWFNTLRCNECGPVVQRIQVRCMAKVRRAIARGQLMPVAGKTCVDCGAQATVYDHRDYSKPLDVQPVCRSCNMKRGPGLVDLAKAA